MKTHPTSSWTAFALAAGLLVVATAAAGVLPARPEPAGHQVPSGNEAGADKKETSPQVLTCRIGLGGASVSAADVGPEGTCSFAATRSRSTAVEVDHKGAPPTVLASHVTVHVCPDPAEPTPACTLATWSGTSFPVRLDVKEPAHGPRGAPLSVLIRFDGVDTFGPGISEDWYDVTVTRTGK